MWSGKLKTRCLMKIFETLNYLFSSWLQNKVYNRLMACWIRPVHAISCHAIHTVYAQITCRPMRTTIHIHSWTFYCQINHFLSNNTGVALSRILVGNQNIGDWADWQGVAITDESIGVSHLLGACARAAFPKSLRLRQAVRAILPYSTVGLP